MELHFIETSPLVENYYLEDFINCITEIESRMGDLFSLQSEFNTFTYPYSLWIKFLNRTVDDENIINEHAVRIYSRIKSFYEHVEHYKFRIIMDKRLIEHVVKTGKYPTYNMYREYYTEDIIEHFENIVLLLKKYKNYEIALVSDNTNTLVNKIDWSVKGDYGVYLHIRERIYSENLTSSNEFVLLIKETTIASAFKDYFLELWDKIPPYVDKDKKLVIEWLENQICILKNNYLIPDKRKIGMVHNYIYYESFPLFTAIRN